MKSIETIFPYAQVDGIAELESWRKEISRPIYHIHKWWAKRLGSVFRAIILGALLDESEDVWEQFYLSHDMKDKVVLDPFMGSGTTIGECVKLGVRAVGCDVNPVSSFIVKQCLVQANTSKLEVEFKNLESNVAEQVRCYYKTFDPATGAFCDVLYYFWVKVVTTPELEEIPLFSSYVFSKNAYPKAKPNAQILCPECGTINEDRYDSTHAICSNCQLEFNPQDGPVKGSYVVTKSGGSYKIKDLVQQQTSPPEHKLYAIMALTPAGEKKYLSPQTYDFELYQESSRTLLEEDLPLPNMAIRSGHNTNQIRGYNYLFWRQLFNDRQLLSLGRLLKEILKIEDVEVREQFICLFSSTLEFNNLFCSFKGEGTGAVRHMFSNHILKPERMVLENNVWGTNKSSGSFSTLFRSKLLKAKQYLDEPFEIRLSANDNKKSEKVVCSAPIRTTVTNDPNIFRTTQDSTLILNGDSACLPLDDESIDAVVTDPPYFDFVHYSELSDFFFAWLAPILKDNYSFFGTSDSSHEGEVQSKDPEVFATKLCAVFTECNRVLKSDGLLLFTFHHSAAFGWKSIYDAVTNSGFSFVAAHPIKAEMAVSTTKSASSKPINLDIILVCKKGQSERISTSNIWTEVVESAQLYEARFHRMGRELSDGDRNVILASQILLAACAAEITKFEVEQLLNRVFDAKQNTVSLFSL